MVKFKAPDLVSKARCVSRNNLLGRRGARRATGVGPRGVALLLSEWRINGYGARTPGAPRAIESRQSGLNFKFLLAQHLLRIVKMRALTHWLVRDPRKPQRLGSVPRALDEELWALYRPLTLNFTRSSEEPMESIQHSTTGAALHAQTDGTRGSSVGRLLNFLLVSYSASCVLLARASVAPKSMH